VRIRKTPNIKGRIIGSLNKNERVEYCGEISTTILETYLRNRFFVNYFLKIKTNNNTIGWVFGGALVDAQYALDKKVRILGTGDQSYRVEKLKLDNWYGLFEQNGDFFIKKVVLSSKPGVSGGEAFSTTKINTDPGDAVILINNLPSIKEGHVLVLKNLKKIKQLPSDSSINFSFNNLKYKLALNHKIVAVDYDGKFSDHGYEYILSRVDSTGKKLSKIIASSIPGKPQIFWAGDLDSDGLIDMLVGRDNVAWGEIDLLLSSKAGSNELMEKIDSTIFWSAD